ncbi:MAG TPA: histidine kinase [Chitinophagaceae bacterium]|nr:histidine kinase [Chitinophagaceae bacterium]
MNKTIDRKKFIFYLLLAGIFLLLWVLGHLSKYRDQFWELLLNNIWRVVYVTVVNFTFFELAVPFVLKKRRFLIYNILLGLVILWLYLMLWSYGLYAWRLIGIGLHTYTRIIVYDTIDEELEGQMGFSMASVFFYGIIRHIYNYVKLNQAAQQLRIEKQQAELNYLRSQTNPHFLFNTLNNIYSLTRDKSDLAPESILRLSKILRFMLYETGGSFISIEQELKIIGDYIALEKLRYDESLRINFNYNVEDLKQAIPPLLLIPLVENAFKHGASETRNLPFVDIHLSIKHRQLRFVVKNSVDDTLAEKHVKENIGLSNLRRQLELLYTEYSLTIQHEKNFFTALLTINLASHV